MGCADKLDAMRIEPPVKERLGLYGRVHLDRVLVRQDGIDFVPSYWQCHLIFPDGRDRFRIWIDIDNKTTAITMPNSHGGVAAIISPLEIVLTRTEAASAADEAAAAGNVQSKCQRKERSSDNVTPIIFGSAAACVCLCIGGFRKIDRQY